MADGSEPGNSSVTISPFRTVVVMRLGLDIGGTKTHAVLLNDHDAVFHEARVPTMRGNAGVVRSATSAVEQLLGSAGMSLASVSSSGVGIPGVVDQRNGVVSNARNIGVQALDLGCRLQEALGKAVRIENDVNASVI